MRICIDLFIFQVYFYFEIYRKNFEYIQTLVMNFMINNFKVHLNLLIKFPAKQSTIQAIGQNTYQGSVNSLQRITKTIYSSYRTILDMVILKAQTHPDDSNDDETLYQVTLPKPEG